VILGIGRALGETKAKIMVFGTPSLCPAAERPTRCPSFEHGKGAVDGNIAVEINNAAGAHRSALFSPGLLFLVILRSNSCALLMRERA
jgi:phosphate transport system permease protein